MLSACIAATGNTLSLFFVYFKLKTGVTL